MRTDVKLLKILRKHLYLLKKLRTFLGLCGLICELAFRKIINTNEEIRLDRIIWDYEHLDTHKYGGYYFKPYAILPRWWYLTKLIWKYRFKKLKSCQ